MSYFEKINATVKTNVIERRNEAIKKIIAVLFKVLLVYGALIGLEAIGFISETFMVILMAVAICVGTFKAGYISRDIKF